MMRSVPEQYLKGMVLGENILTTLVKQNKRNGNWLDIQRRKN